ncbi:MAG: hypothetical protein DI539_28365, partial [Flavobacterium psychrophilum]
NVLQKGTSNGTVTDVDGNFRISIPTSGAVLSFSFIGLQSQEIEVGVQSTVDIRMATDVKQLSEVVVSALGIEQSAMNWVRQLHK